MGVLAGPLQMPEKGLERPPGDQVVAPGSTGRRLLVEDDHWRVRQDADIEQPDCVAAGVGGPSSSQSARMPGRTSRWGGFARPRSGLR